ncbi:ATP synthase subunit I [Bacillus taeanensis]|uniref:ATP synthase subunit n=1 Tax=Bacillus taeanensis TaxID=273032 RepID=A0A366XQU0_9BACI|nr:ATP synthase subunit I [Bacillus taeanensis]RBW68720.1 ATP synthase subunit [Bacillus taeanensis]
MQKDRNLKRFMQLTVYIIALLVLGWGFTPYQSVFLGAILGLIIGSFNIWFMYRKVKKLGQAAAEGTKAYSLGMLTRFALAGLAVLVALRYPDTFHLLSMVIGFSSAYIIIFIDFFLKTIRTQ